MKEKIKDMIDSKAFTSEQLIYVYTLLNVFADGNAEEVENDEKTV